MRQRSETNLHYLEEGETCIRSSVSGDQREEEGVEGNLREGDPGQEDQDPEDKCGANKELKRRPVDQETNMKKKMRETCGKETLSKTKTLRTRVVKIRR